MSYDKNYKAIDWGVFDDAKAQLKKEPAEDPLWIPMAPDEPNEFREICIEAGDMVAVDNNGRAVPIRDDQSWTNHMTGNWDTIGEQDIIGDLKKSIDKMMPVEPDWDDLRVAADWVSEQHSYDLGNDLISIVESKRSRFDIEHNRLLKSLIPKEHPGAIAAIEQSMVNQAQHNQGLEHRRLRSNHVKLMQSFSRQHGKSWRDAIDGITYDDIS